LLSSLGYDVVVGNSHSLLSYYFNFILGAGFFLHEQEIKNYKLKHPNVKHIHIYYGNKIIGDIVNSKSNQISCSPNYVDEVWISPHYNIYKNYLMTFYKTDKIFTIPYIWENQFVKNLKFQKSKNISILEPNLNVTKHCMPSILIAEELYNQDNDAFDSLNVYCSNELKKYRFFKSWIRHLNVFKDNKLKLENRLPFEEIIKNGPGVFLSHQVMNELNYVYLEALYLNIPLVHNAKTLKQTGYYYKNYDTKQGAKQLSLALNQEKNRFLKNNLKLETEKLLYNYNPKNPKIINEYKRLFK